MSLQKSECECVEPSSALFVTCLMREVKPQTGGHRCLSFFCHLDSRGHFHLLIVSYQRPVVRERESVCEGQGTNIGESVNVILKKTHQTIK